MFFWNSLLCDPTDVGNLIFGCSTFSKSSLYMWKFLVHMLLKPTLKDFDHNFLTCNELNYCLNILWHCLSLGLEWTLMFSSFVATAVFQICWYIECTTLTASSFRIWNSSAGVSSSPLALFIVMLPKAPLISHSRMSGPRWVATPCANLGF